MSRSALAFSDLHLVDTDSFNIQNDQTGEIGLEWDEFRDVKKPERLTITRTPLNYLLEDQRMKYEINREFFDTSG